MFDKVTSIDELYTLNENLLFEMTNVQKKTTWLPYDLWIDSRGKDRKTTHSEPRLNVDVDGNLIPMTISENPDIPESVKKTGLTTFRFMSKVQAYIRAYYPILIAHYNRQIGDKETLKYLLNLKSAPKSLSDFEKETKDETLYYRIEYSWDTDDLLYVLNVINNNKEELVEQHFILNVADLGRILSKMSSKYNCTEIINLDKNKD